jgi:crossover junction endodeoxyribonuclease RuvC
MKEEIKKEKNNYIGLSIGIDPSLSETGIVGIRGNKIIFSHLIKTKKTEDTPAAELQRILDIVAEIKFFLEKYNPGIVIMESVAMNARNTTALVQLSGLNYFLREVMFKNYNSFLVTPTGLKKFATGKGNCQKDLILLEIYKRYKISFNNNNSADAFILAKIGNAIMNKEEKLTKSQKEVIKIIKKQHGKDN